MKYGPAITPVIMLPAGDKRDARGPKGQQIKINHYLGSAFRLKSLALAFFDHRATHDSVAVRGKAERGFEGCIMRPMPEPSRFALVLFFVCGGAASSSIEAQRSTKHENAVLDLWAAGTPAFGVLVPNENPSARGQGRGEPGVPQPKPVYTRAGGEKLAANPLYDFVFLNLEGAYDATAIKAIADSVDESAQLPVDDRPMTARLAA